MGKRTNTATWREDKQMWQINAQKTACAVLFIVLSPAGQVKKSATIMLTPGLMMCIVNANKAVSIFLDERLAEIKITTSYSNYKQYNGYATKWIKPVIGRVKMGNLTEGHIQTVVNRAFEKGKLSKKTLCNIRGCFASFLRYSRMYNAAWIIRTIY